MLKKLSLPNLLLLLLNHNVVELKEENLSEASLSEASLSEASLSEASLSEASIRRVEREELVVLTAIKKV
tara:strand:- start:394 stop:603 length:210 start_codon:yes stop_codon:yes gene_type:complete